MGIGAAASDRYVYVALFSKRVGSPLSISSVTIGGVTATPLITQSNAESNSPITAIYYANVPTGTTADVVVTYNAEAVRSYCSTYRVVGAFSPTTASDDAGSTAEPASLNMNIPSGDSFAFGISYCDNAGQDPTWTGLTENDDTIAESLSRVTVASDSFLSSETNRTIECSYPFGSNFAACAVVIA